MNKTQQHYKTNPMKVPSRGFRGVQVIIRGNVQILLCSLLLFLTIAGCRPKLVETKPDDKVYGEWVVEENLLTCFDEGATGEDGKPYNCEISGIASYSDVMIFGNDKNSNEVSTVFTGEKTKLRTGKMDSPFSLKQDIFFDIHKIEDMAPSTDGKYLFVTTGFDRLKDDNSEWDNYNILLGWDILGNEFQIISASENQGISSSKTLRKEFQDLIGTPHIKIEGLMVLPGNRLVFGVREKGSSWKTPEYIAVFISCTYEIKAGKITLKDDMKISYKFDTSIAQENLGLSSMTYDPTSQNIYLTTSLEEGEEAKKTFGTYLWVLPMDDYIAKKAPKLIHTKDGKPLFSPHKGEGIAKFDDNSFMIIHDNDRTDIPLTLPNGNKVSRRKNQAVYSIVKLGSR